MSLFSFLLCLENPELISRITNGLGAERKCETATGWFKDKITEFKPHEHLTFTLTGCNQPMKSLEHSYSLKKIRNQTQVSQVMKYTMKFGVIGKLMDALMGRRQSDKQIKLFFNGLKEYVEKQKLTNMDYTNKIKILADTKSCFIAVSQEVNKWWGTVDNTTSKLGDEFSVCFGPTKWRFKITQYDPFESIT